MAKRRKNSQSDLHKPLLGGLLNDVLEVPPEVVFDLPRLTLTGNFLLEIENHRGVLESDDERLKLKVNGGWLEISGRDFCLNGISGDEVGLAGEIQKIELFMESPVDYKR